MSRLRERWSPSEDFRRIYDSEFPIDGSLTIDGDFKDDDEREQYVTMICDALNAKDDARRYQAARSDPRFDIRILGVGKRSGESLDQAIDAMSPTIAPKGGT